MTCFKLASKYLNNTLIFFVNLLYLHNINNWFIGYGTLLGIVRNNSCIEGDDDVDIVIDKKHYHTIMKILKDNQFTVFDIVADIDGADFGYHFDNNIIKTDPTNHLSSVDFYFADVDEQGNFHDTWEKVIWSNCFVEDKQFILYDWNGTILPIPSNYETKLINRYGEDWQIPQNSKGPQPPKTII